MKRTILTTLVIFALSTLAMAGTLRQSCKMYSQILGDTVNYAIYLPSDYQSDDKRYPLFYLLHGLSDDHLSWSQQGDIKRIVDGEIDLGRATEMIIVMPDGKDHWYANSADGKVRYEDMFFEELMPHIDATYRTRPEREFRAIAGLSMGGQGALLYATKHPDRFYTCCALSAAVYTDEDIAAGRGAFPQLFERIYGKGMPTEHWKKNNVINLMASMSDKGKHAVKYWIDCGDDDFLYRGNASLHTVMRDCNIPHQFRMRDGGHNWKYWREGIVDILGYVSVSFLRGQ